jgi:sodium/bile acid cotransporter 7
VPAALCAATASNLLGMALTPLMAGLLLGTQGGFSAHALMDIVVQLLLPFIVGQIARPLIGGWATRNKALLSLVDRGSILLVVYGAFSESVTEGIWHKLDLSGLLSLGLVDAGLLLCVILITTSVSRALGFSRADEITVVFCGSKKSLASGLPMATVLLAGQSAGLPVGLVLLPLMLFHQIQLMACAALARRYAARSEAKSSASLATA